MCNRPDGQRVIQNVGGAVRTYLYDGAARIEEQDSAGNIVADHEYGPTGCLGHNDGGPFITFTSDPTGNGIQTRRDARTCDALGRVGLALDTV